MRIIHPEHGDVTADIIEALMEGAKLDEPVMLEREAALMAAASGQVARDLSCGRLVAEFPEQVVAEWEAREGKEFFTKAGDGVKYLTKHFEATRVHSRSPHTKVHVNRSTPAPVKSAAAGQRYRVTGRRGRWAA